MMRWLVGLALLVVAMAAATAHAETPAALAARVQKFYEGTHDLHAQFEQTLTSVTSGKKIAKGEVWLKKPGKMRWDYKTPEKKLMIADGQTLWIYEPEDEQAFKQELRSSTLPVSVSFLFGQGKLADEFDIAAPTDKDKITDALPTQTVLKLVPKKASAAYHHLLFYVETSTGLVQSTVIFDQQGGINRLRFASVETDKGTADGKFNFTPPAGTHVISAP